MDKEQDKEDKKGQEDKEDKEDKEDREEKEDKEDKDDIEDKEGESKDKETETKIKLPERTPRVHIVRSKTYNLLEDDYSTIKNGIYTEKCLLDDQEVHAWLKNINAQFFEAIISLQKVILIPETDWVNAVKIVEENPSKEYCQNYANHNSYFILLLYFANNVVYSIC